MQPWSDLTAGAAAAALTTILTAETTGSLPSGWQGDYTQQRARDWLDERAAECTVLLAHDLSSSKPVGVIMLAEDDEDAAPQASARLGYVLARSAWGNGVATELVRGLVSWLQQAGDVSSISGGVARGHAASARVLEKCGFAVASTEDDVDIWARVL